MSTVAIRGLSSTRLSKCAPYFCPMPYLQMTTGNAVKDHSMKQFDDDLTSTKPPLAVDTAHFNSCSGDPCSDHRRATADLAAQQQPHSLAPSLLNPPSLRGGSCPLQARRRLAHRSCRPPPEGLGVVLIRGAAVAPAPEHRLEAAQDGRT